MIIEIGDAARIRYESGNYMVEKKRVVQEGKNAGVVEWDVVGYNGSLQTAAQSLLTRHFHLLAVATAADSAKDLKTLIDAIDCGADLIARACEAHQVKKE